MNQCVGDVSRNVILWTKVNIKKSIVAVLKKKKYPFKLKKSMV